MIYYDLTDLEESKSTDEIHLCAKDLFPENGVNYAFGFEEAKKNRRKPPIFSGEFVKGRIPAYLFPDEWAYNFNGLGDVCIRDLTCCAAVLVYTTDDDGNPILIEAGHAQGGIISDDNIKSVSEGEAVYVVFATPTLKVGDTTGYEDSINKMAEAWGTQTICVIEGFPSPGSVYANGLGVFSCAKDPNSSASQNA